MRYLIFLLSLFLVSSCRSQQKNELPSNADGNTLLWEISGKDLKKPSYLFGTFHMMCKDDIRFSDNLRKALSSSKELMLEMDMDDPSNTLGAIFFINMKNGKTLKDLYSAEEYKRLEKYFKDSLGTGLMMLQRMKPNFLEAMLYPKMMPCKTMSGVEEELMKLAKTDKKEITGLETIAFQASVFDSIPYDTQARDLLRTIDSIQNYRLYFDTMLHIYKNQQLSQMENLFEKEPGFEETKDVLLDQRNRNWVGQLKSILPKKSIFIAVGAGHLPGDQGLISLLKKEGYILRPIVNKGVANVKD